MQRASGSPPVMRFGVFDVDLRAGELHKSGVRIKLQEQPFQVLAVLLERAGEVDTHEELHQKLWGADTFVDFEHGLNKAINRIREALGDEADNPRFVETLPRRGYRFIAPLEMVGTTRAELHHPLTPSSERRGASVDSPPGSGGGQGVVAIGAIHESPLRKHWMVAITGGVVLAVATVALALNLGGLRDRLLTFVGARHGVPLSKIKSIAVLPLENLSGQPEQEYFADGMTEALISNLGKIGSLRVISRTSVTRYKQTKKSIPEIARELNVDAVIEGSVQRSGDRVRITTQLVQTNPEKHLWSESYERDVLALQGEVARAIASQIRIKLTPQAQTRLARARPVNPEAYESYLRGRYFLSRWPEGAEKPAKYFQEAIDKDPNYGEAWAGLATSANLLGYFNPPHQSFPKAKAAAERALQLNPSLGEAYVALGEYKSHYEHDWAGAEQHFKRAIELNPNSSQAHIDYAALLLGTARFDAAITEAKRGQQLDPVGLLANRMLGFVYMWARRYDESIVHNQKTLELDPNHHVARFQLAGCYTLLGRYAEALAEFKKLGDITADPYVGFLYAVSGRHSEARKVANELERLSKREYVSPFGMAVPYAGLRDHDKAIEWLERGYHEHAAMMFLLKVDPFLDNVRDDPRFQDLLRRMIFPD